METLFTLLLTDLIDSTAINARLGDAAMAELWQRHDEGARALARQWRGHEVDRSDGFLMLFGETVDAAGFAAEYHRMLAALPLPLAARAALHVGPLTLQLARPEDVARGAKPMEAFGIAKSVTGRLMSLAGPGQTLASAEAARVLAAAGRRCVAHGHWRFKGIDEPVEVWETGDAHAPFVPPPDAEKAQRVVRFNGQWIGLRDVPRQLPAERDTFFDRDADLNALAARLDEGARLVVLHGPGGIGKTRLALRYGWAWLGQYPGGVYCADLAPARGVDGILHALARALDVPLGSEPLAQLGHVIAARGRCLVILDNFEQVARHAAETLGTWLDAALHARFLVTSREALGLPGEQTLALPPLPAADAVALFHARARAADARYDAAASPPEVMHSLVRLLDGLPLAVELAAARVSVLDPARLLARMGDRFRLLTSRGGRPQRQATLRATIDWSWDALDATDRAALAQLSVFAGGFTLAAAEAVLELPAPAGAEPPWVPDVLQSLVDKSLLRAPAGDRFTMLGTIQAYAGERLAAPEAAATRRRHWRYFGGLAEARVTADGCAELDNVVAACRHATAAGDAAGATACLRLAWAALRLTGPFGAAPELARPILALPQLDAERRATVEWVCGAAGLSMGTPAPARRHLQAALAALPAGAEPALAARVFCTAGEIEALAGAHDAAQAHLAHADAHAQAAGDAQLRCQVLNALGALAGDRGQLAVAQAHYEQALALAQACGSLHWQSGVLGNLGVLYYANGRLGPAKEALERALAIAHRSGDRRWEGNTRCNLGLIHHEQGRPAEAERELSMALEMARRMGHRALEGTVLCNLGLVHEALGDLEAACRHHEAAVDIAAAAGDGPVEAQLRAYLGSALARARRVREARRCIERGVERLAAADHPAVRGLLACARAEAEFAAERPAPAEAALAEARACLARAGANDDSELGRQIRNVAARWLG